MYYKGNILERTADVFIYIILALAGFITLFPFWVVVVGSVLPFSDQIQSSIVLIPTSIDLSSYEYIFSDDTFLRGIMISFGITTISTVYHVIVTAMVSYGLTFENLPGRKLIFKLIIFTMFFSGGMIPVYLLIRQLGLVDNLLVMILPVFSNAFHIILMRTFFLGIPEEIKEAAKIDGAGYQRIFWTMIIPLSKPVIATISLFIAVSQWNNWFTPMLYLNDRELWPMALILRSMVVEADPETMFFSTNEFFFSDGIKYASVVVAVIPILCIYPFVQKYFVKGTMVGAVKS
ncbi:carbohydrate ABC transporter permease [Vallitalea okinawensis]|uniref:carbohydrate ABC transporter permease n=1 Tax=Vallitalea okinawensis TaxID=2078660 RepID=UPI000CFD2BDC|nr:carbohydrate ABC transporter permease [Vallitalea okinawensis]